MTLPQLTSDTSAFEFWSWPVLGFLGLAAVIAFAIVESKLRRRRDYWTWFTVFTAVVLAAFVVHALLTELSNLWGVSGVVVVVAVGTVLCRCKTCGALAREGWLRLRPRCVECGALRNGSTRADLDAPVSDRSARLERFIATEVALDHAARRHRAHALRRAVNHLGEWLERRRRIRFAAALSRGTPDDAASKFAGWCERCSKVDGRATDEPTDGTTLVPP